jgi:hypothetical protein
MATGVPSAPSAPAVKTRQTVGGPASITSGSVHDRQIRSVGPTDPGPPSKDVNVTVHAARGASSASPAVASPWTQSPLRPQVLA